MAVKKEIYALIEANPQKEIVIASGSVWLDAHMLAELCTRLEKMLVMHLSHPEVAGSRL